MAPKTTKPGIVNEEMEDDDAMNGEQPEVESPEEDSSEEGEEATGKQDLDSQLTDGADEPNVTPEEQRMYDTFMLVVHQRMYSKTAFPQLLKRLAAGQQDVGFTLGHAGAMLLQSALASIRGAGKDVPEDILMAAGEEILSDLLDIAEGAGLIRPEDRDKVGTRALYEGMKIFGNNLLKAGVPDAAREAARETVGKLGLTPEQASGNSAPAQAANAYAQTPQPQPQQAPQQGVVNAAQQGA